MKIKVFNQTLMRQAFAFSVIATLFGGCSLLEDKKSATPVPQEMPPPHVSVYKVEATDISVGLEYPAKVVSYQQVGVAARVSGILEKRHFTEGKFVKAGDPLYQIDSARYGAILQEAKAQVGVASANVKEATRNWDRVKALFAKDAVSQKERDAALSAYEIANANLKAAEAAVKRAQIDFDYTKVKAPISGFTGLDRQDVGSYVGTSPDNSILTTIIQTDPIYVEFSLPDIEVLKRRYTLVNENLEKAAEAGLPVVIRTADGTTYPYKGTFTFIDNAVDDGTGTIKVKALFPNPKDILIPGFFVRATVEGLIQKDALTIPQKALMQDALGAYVYVEKDGKVAKVPVKMGNSYKDRYIITEGLNVGDKVITNNTMKLRPGAPVIVAEAKE